MFRSQEHEEPEQGKEGVPMLSLMWKRMLVHAWFMSKIWKFKIQTTALLCLQLGVQG